MKGFKKDGKFRPTGKKNQSSLKKSSLDKPDWVNPEIVKQHKAWLKHKDEEERKKESTDNFNSMRCTHCKFQTNDQEKALAHKEKNEGHMIEMFGKGEFGDSGTHQFREKESMDEHGGDLDKVIKKLNKEWTTALNKDDELPKVHWEADIVYTGSHGTVSDEYFTLTAFGKGLGDIEVQEGISNFDWNENDEGNAKEESTQDDYDEWLADTLEAVEDGMYMALRDTIVATYYDPDKEKN